VETGSSVDDRFAVREYKRVIHNDKDVGSGLRYPGQCTYQFLDVAGFMGYNYNVICGGELLDDRPFYCSTRVPEDGRPFSFATMMRLAASVDPFTLGTIAP